MAEFDVFNDDEEVQKLKAEAEKENARRQLDALTSARECLGGKKGEKFIEHLETVAHWYYTTAKEGDPYTTHFNEGKRALLIYMKRLLRDSQSKEYMDRILEMTK